MKGNKPHARYRIIDQKLSRKRKCTWEELSEACQRELDLPELPSRSTILHDITFLREHHRAPISKGEKTYRYTVDGFSIFNAPMDSEEMGQLQQLRQMIVQLGQLPNFQQFDEILLQLEQHLGLPNPENPYAPAPISFERLDIVDGFEYLRPLYQAILEKSVLKLAYQKFDADEAEEIRFHAWYLKEYNHRWSVFGWNQQAGEMRIYSLDRIKNIRNASGNYRPSDFDFEQFFRERIGVWRGPDEKLETVRLRLSKRRAPYLETKRLHDSQVKISEDEFGAVFEFRLVINRQLESKILEFGDDVEVLEPECLRAKILQVLMDAVRKYGSNHE